MSRKDYVRAAAIVAAIRADNEHDANVVQGAFIALFAPDNPLFDRDTFVKACGGAS